MNGRPAILLTGGSGFFGWHLAQRFTADGWSVRILDRAPPPDWAAELEVSHHRGDVCDGPVVDVTMAGVDVVLHAAFAPPERPVNEIWRVNLEGTRTVLSSALHGHRPRVVLLSSTIVDRPLQPHPFLAGAPLSRLHAYRDSRIAAEDEARRAGAAGLSVVVARPKTFLGPGALGPFALLFELIRRGRAMPVLGGGGNRYQLLDVRDLAAGLSLLASSASQGCFWFGSEHFGTTADELTALAAHAGTGSRVRGIHPSVGRLGLRCIELAGLTPLAEWHHMAAKREDSVVDISRARAELGWRPDRDNMATLIESYDWYARAHESGGAGTTHPVPATHRILARLGGTVRRSGNLGAGREPKS